MAEHAAVINVSWYKPAEGRRDDLLAAMKRLAEEASVFDGCFGAQACVSDIEKDSLVAVSRWRNQEAMQEFARRAGAEAQRDHLTALLAEPARHENLTPV